MMNKPKDTGIDNFKGTFAGQFNKLKRWQKRMVTLVGSIAGVMILLCSIWHFSGEWRFHIDISDWPEWILPNPDDVMARYWNEAQHNESNVESWLEFYNNGMVVLETYKKNTWNRVFLGKLSHKDRKYIKKNIKLALANRTSIWESVRFGGTNVYMDLTNYKGTALYDTNRNSLEQITDILPYTCSIEHNNVGTFAYISFDKHWVMGTYPELSYMSGNINSVYIWQRTRESFFFKEFYSEVTEQDYPLYNSLVECFTLNELNPEWYEELEMINRLDMIQ